MKFQDSYTFKETGLSKVIIRHRKHLFSGEAHLHPDDNWNEITGCRYAEIRAKIKALKAEHKQKKQACEECRKFVKAITQYKIFNKEDSSAKAMYKQLNKRIKEVNNLADKINQLEFMLYVAIKQQDKFNQKIKNN